MGGVNNIPLSKTFWGCDFLDVFIVFGVLIILILLGIPVAFSMGLSTLLAIYLKGTWNVTVILSQRIYSGATSFVLFAIPFYILAGLLMNQGGMTQKIMKFAQLVVGRVSGGLGHVNILASMVFSGMSGSSVADASGLGVVEIETMSAAGYDKRFSAAVTAASATIGPIVPPSIPFVIYGGIAGVSVGRLFLGGIIPGVFMGLGLMIAVYIVSKKRSYPITKEKFSLREIISSGISALLAVGSIIIILGGIIGGIFTPTEAAVVASIYAFIVGTIIFRDLKISQIPSILAETARHSIRVLFIIGVAASYTWALTLLHVPQKVVALFGNISSHPILVLLIINGLLLLLGCFMETISIMLLTIPILLPVVVNIGMDPIHFGVMMTLNLMIGQLTPPMGILLYSVSGISKIPIQQIIPELKPYLIALLTVLLIITFVPSITLFLPNILMG